MAKCIIISKMDGMRAWAKNRIDDLASKDFSIEIMYEFKIDAVQSGDVVVGCLSFEDVLNVNMAGATYKHLTFDMTPLPDDQMTPYEIERHRPLLNEYFVSTSEFSRVRSKVGEWNAFTEEYALDYDVQSTINDEGIALNMGESDTPPSKRIFIERMEDTWKITLSSTVNNMEVKATVDMFDSGTIAMYNCLPEIQKY